MFWVHTNLCIWLGLTCKFEVIQLSKSLYLLNLLRC
uniref:Uncharacterized protein n=1 Tax=Arundo donax TaxID=35708 RepID=A0A0A9GG82_ARUDO